jgi:hypothetical protein
MFERTPVVTVRSSIHALRLKLWDEERECLVRYPTRRVRSAAACHTARSAWSPGATGPVDPSHGRL